MLSKWTKKLRLWLRGMYNRTFFKPIDATRHLDGDSLSLFLEIQKAKGMNNPIRNEMTLWDEAANRALAISLSSKLMDDSTEPKEKLEKKLRLYGFKDAHAIDLLVNPNSPFVNKDKSLNAERLVREWLENHMYMVHRKYVLKSRNVGIGVSHSKGIIFVSVIFG